MVYTVSEDLSSVEVELKFAVPLGAFDALVDEVRRGGSKTQRMQAIYYDTPDGCLGAQRVVVRLRKEGHRWVQTAKASTGDSFRRLEHNVAVALPHGQRSPVVDLSRHDGTAVGAAIQAALGGALSQERATALVERFRVDVSRLSRRVQVGDLGRACRRLGRHCRGPALDARA